MSAASRTPWTRPTSSGSGCSARADPIRRRARAPPFRGCACPAFSVGGKVYAMSSTTTTSSGSLRTYLITRLLLVIPMVWILVTLVFFVLRVVGDPIKSAFAQLPPAEIARRRHAAGLDRPLLSQYWDYLKGVAHFDFGSSLTDHTQVSTIL